jgi:RNA polymerase sigma-70 factor, ECF subfamily
VDHYEQLITPHLNDLRKYCFYLTKSKWDGEDLFQETLVKSLLFVINKEKDKEIKPFLLRVARNLVIDDYRKRQRRWQDKAVPVRSFYTDNDYSEVRGAIEWMAERFPSRNIEMWLLAEYFGYTMQEIADDLGCTVPTVKSVLFRTRESLRDSGGLTRSRKVIPFEVERWSEAIMNNQPQALLA